MRRGGGGSCTGPVEVNRGPLMTSGTLYRLPPSHFPRCFPHHRYRIIFIGGRNRGAEILKALPAPIAQALHSRTQRRAQPGNEGGEGVGVPAGAGRSEPDYLALNRLDDAKKAIEQERQVAWAAGKPGSSPDFLVI
jgi:hypothetical protein